MLSRNEIAPRWPNGTGVTMFRRLFIITTILAGGGALAGGLPAQNASADPATLRGNAEKSQPGAADSGAALLQAAYDGDAARVKQLIKAGAPVNKANLF